MAKMRSEMARFSCATASCARRQQAEPARGDLCRDGQIQGPARLFGAVKPGAGCTPPRAVAAGQVRPISSRQTRRPVEIPQAARRITASRQAHADLGHAKRLGLAKTLQGSLNLKGAFGQQRA